MRLAARILARDRRRRQLDAARELVNSDRRAPGDPGPLLDFIPHLTPAFRRPDHLATLAEAFERGARDPGSVRICESIPVRHGKTSLVHHAIPWLLRKDPTRSILYCSYAFGFAKKQTAKAKTLARKAVVRLDRGRRTDEWGTKAGGFVKAAGIGGQITGEGFTDIILDDPHKNRAEAESRVIREGVIEAFLNDVFTRQDPRGTNIYIIHARWHVNDLIGVLARMKPHPFSYHNSPALDAKGNALAPWLFDAEALREIQATLGPYVFGSLYQGTPKRRGGNLFNEPTLATLTEPEQYRIAIGIDLARSSSTRGDYNAAVVIRLDVDTGKLDILEAVRERGTVTDRVRGDGDVADLGFAREVSRLLHMYPAAELAMYAVDIELAFVRVLEMELTEIMGYEVTVASMPIAGDKYLRAQPYAASWNKGRLRIQGRSSVSEDAEEDDIDRHGWQGPFVVEHVEFTGGKGADDDWVDAGAAAHDHLSQEKKTGLEEAMMGAGK